ncbi:hypothetical protein ACWC5I_14315, partial [Kitasatospora sp. NPDC001574]
MPKPPSTSAAPPLRHRLLIGLGVLLVVGLLAGLLARSAGGGHTAPPPPASSTAARPETTPVAPPRPASPPAEAGPTVTRPPRTASPTDFATAFARTLWTYDARTVTQQSFVSGLRLWLTPET